MPMYAFKAVDRDNKIAEGQLSAADVDTVARHLFSNGQTALTISEVSTANSAFGFGKAIFRRRSKAHTALVEVLSQINMLLNAGMPIERALSHLESSGQQQDVARLAKRLKSRIKSGTSFANALRQDENDIAPFIVNAIAAGEASGHLEDVLSRLVAYLERANKIRSDIKSALVYPAILVTMAAIAVGILMLVLVPQFKPLFEGAEDRIPWITKLIIAASDYFQPALLILLIAGPLLFFGLRSALRSEARRQTWDRWKLALPFSIGSLNLDIQVAILSRLLSLLLQNGIPLHSALTLSRDAIPNRAIAAAIEHARERVREGGRLSVALSESNMFSPFMLDLLKVGEEASNVTGVLSRIADLAEIRIERSVKRLMDLFIPFLTIGIGVVIALIVASILTALLSVNELALG